MAEIVLLSNHSSEDVFDNHSHTISITDLNTKLKSCGLTSNDEITKVELQVKVKFQHETLAGIGMRMFYSSRFCNNDVASGTDITSETQMTDGSYMTYTKEITSYVNPKHPFNIQNTSYSNLCYIYMRTDNLFRRSYYCEYAKLVITYETHTHSYTSKVTKAATCTSAGETTYTCACGHSYVDKTKPAAKGHSWGNPTYTWSADGKTCTAKQVCSTDSSHTETASATVTSAVKTAATCIAKGTTRYTAKFSVSWATTQTKDVQDIAAKGHTWKNATCTTPKTCTVCGATEGSALGHDYKSVVTAPTATTSGYTTHTCSRCGDSYKDTYIHRITLKSNNDSYGTVTGGGDYADGETITIKAVPNTGYKFVKWSDGLAASTFTYKATRTETLTAIFEQLTFTVRWRNEYSGEGVIETDENVPYGTKPSYDGATPTVESDVYDYTFIGWRPAGGDVISDVSQLPVVTSDLHFFANFSSTYKYYTVKVILFDTELTEELRYNKDFTFTASDVVGYKFVQWTDGNTDNPRTVTVTGDATYQAIYERIAIPIKVNGKQVTGCYIVPSTKTVIFDVGTTPTVDAIPENSYPLKKIHINGNRTY